VFLFLRLCHPPRSTLFPYTTLFRSQEDRLLVRLDDVPSLLLKTLVQVEDRNFYSHHGVSLRGIARALLVNVQSGRLAQGGSTLRSEEHTSELQSRENLVCRLLLEKK